MVINTVRAMIKINNRYLLVQRADTGAGQWQFPGGGADSQSLDFAVKREVQEETGYIISDLKKYKQFINPRYGSLNTYYKAKIVGGNPKMQKSEIMNMGWFTLEEIKRLPITVSTKKVINNMRC